jgi:hypothetical protein
MDTFSAQLRDATELNTLCDDLMGVVEETMQPARASLWVRPDPAMKDKKKRAAIRESGHEKLAFQRYPPKCVEEVFSEVRLNGVLRR